MPNLKNITEVPVVESADGLNLIVNDNGSAKQIAASAVGAQADFNVTDETNPAFIKNKPAVVQADWDVKDEANPAFVKNKPFYDTREYDNITLTFDGDITGKETVIISGSDTEPAYLVKISDKVASKEEFIGASVSLVRNGETQTLEVSENAIAQPLGEEYFAIYEIVVVCTSEVAMTDTITITPGIWMACVVANGQPVMYCSELSWHGLVSGELKQVEAKYVAGLEEEWDLDLTVDITWNAETSAQNDPVFTAAEGYSYDAFVAKIEAMECPKVLVRLKQAVSADTVMYIMDRQCNIIVGTGAAAGAMYGLFISFTGGMFSVVCNPDGTFTMQ